MSWVSMVERGMEILDRIWKMNWSISARAVPGTIETGIATIFTIISV